MTDDWKVGDVAYVALWYSWSKLARVIKVTIVIAYDQHGFLVGRSDDGDHKTHESRFFRTEEEAQRHAALEVLSRGP